MLQRWVIPGIVPRTPNSGFLGSHWRTIQAERRKWGEALALIVRERTARFRGKARLLIIAHRPRFLDRSNMFAAVKPIEDAMVRLGWLEDDDDAHCDLIADQVKCHRNDKCTVIEWEVIHGDQGNDGRADRGG